MSYASSLRFVIGGILLSFCALFPGAEDWPQWRGPNRTGIVDTDDWTWQWPKEGPPVLWRAQTGTGFSAVTVRDGRAFTMGNTDGVDSVYCFDSATGEKLWQSSYPCDLRAKYYEGGPGATPTALDDRVITLSKMGHCYAFSPESGEILWTRDLAKEEDLEVPTWGFSGSPVVEGGRVYLNVGSAGACLDLSSGRTLWMNGTGPSGYATPALVELEGIPAALIFSSKALLAVRREDGKQLWSIPWETKWDINAVDPIVHNDKVFISSHDQGGALYKMTADDTTPIWKNKHVRNHFNSCVLLNGKLYGVDGNTDQPDVSLRCIDFETGDLEWSFSGLGLGSLIGTSGKLIILSDKGLLVIAEATADRFDRLAQSHILGGKVWTPPSLADGRLYCRNAEGHVVCVSMSKRE